MRLAHQEAATPRLAAALKSQPQWRQSIPSDRYWGIIANSESAFMTRTLNATSPATIERGSLRARGQLYRYWIFDACDHSVWMIALQQVSPGIARNPEQPGPYGYIKPWVERKYITVNASVSSISGHYGPTADDDGLPLHAM